jgi:hypothetical protein
LAEKHSSITCDSEIEAVIGARSSGGKIDRNCGFSAICEILARIPQKTYINAEKLHEIRSKSIPPDSDFRNELRTWNE